MRASVLIFAVAALAASASPAMAGGGVCLPTCDIPSHTLGYFPPVTVVGRGSTVSWSTLDIGHTATDLEGFCFHAEYVGPQRGTATFTILDDKLFAVSDTQDGSPVECDAARALPDGSFLLHYACLYHQRMEGHLVIR